MITKDLIDFFRAECPEFENYYDNLRDDKKEKSLSIYDSKSPETKAFEFGTQGIYLKSVQIQIVFTQSKSECEKKAFEFYEKYIMSDENYIVNGFEFYMTPRLARTPIYLGTLQNGCHKYGIDIVVYSN